MAISPDSATGSAPRRSGRSATWPGSTPRLGVPVPLLLGRRTYDIFAAYWPYQEGGEDNEIATLFNRVPKYAASRGEPGLWWAVSTQLGPDLAGAVREIRDGHEHVKVSGA